MLSWPTLQSFLLLLAPLLLPHLLTSYRALRTPPGVRVPAPPHAHRLLLLSALLALLSTLPAFHPPNLFLQTSSSLTTPTPVLFARLAALRPLTPTDHRLRPLLASPAARRAYARFGPAVALACPLRPPAGPLLCAAPALLAPHLLHLLLLALATVAPGAARLRTPALLVAAALAALDFAALAHADAVDAVDAPLAAEPFTHWTRLVWRGLALAAVDTLLGATLWRQSTSPSSAPLPPPPRPLKTRLHATSQRLRALSVVRNGATRSARLRAWSEAYWAREAAVMADVGADRRVLGAQRGAWARLDLEGLGREAEGFVEEILGGTAVDATAREGRLG